MAAGDEEALSALYTMHSSRVYNYALRLIGDERDAEEILQDVFMAAWRTAGRFRGQARVTTWLMRIAHYRAVDRIRAQQRRIKVRALDVSDERLPDEHGEAGFELVGSIDQIQAAFAHLSIEHRAAIELTFTHGLSYAEAATVMGVPFGTVQSRLHYAIRHLRRVLDDGGSS